MRPFYIYLPSNQVDNVMGDNTMDDYTVILPKIIEFDVPWEVALVEIIYPKSIDINQSMEEESITIDNYEIGDMNDHTKPIKTFVGSNGLDLDYIRFKKLKFFVSYGGVYGNDIKDLVKHINSKLPYWWKGGPLKLEDGKVVLPDKKGYNITFSDGLQSHLKLKIENQAQKITRDSSIFLHSNILRRVIFGSGLVPLLRIIKIPVDKKYGETVRETFKNPYYCEIATSSIHNIRIQLLDKDNIPIKFNFGVVIPILHFRPRGGI